MKITNNHNLPESVLNALHRPTYSKGNAHISCTELLNSPRIVQLKRKHWDDVEQDASANTGYYTLIFIVSGKLDNLLGLLSQ